MIDPARLAEYGRLARRLAAERAAAQAIVADVRRMPSAYVREPVPEGWRTMGVVDALCDAARELLARAPDKSEALAEYATVIVALLGESYPRVLRAQTAARAWKELANAYRYRSDCEEALRALDRADTAIEDEPALMDDRAVLKLARATTLREMNRLSEAQALLDSAIVVFDDFGRKDRVAQCVLLIGMIQHQTGNTRKARDAYGRAVVAARKAGDVQTAGSAYSNLAVLAAEEGRTGLAMDNLQQARAIFDELGATGEVARTTWVVGLALLRRGRCAQAIRPLTEARRTFLTLGMPEEAGLAGVQLGEAYLDLGRDQDAHQVVTTVLAEFREAHLNERAFAALEYLRELGPAATREHAHHVAAYLERLRSEPTLLFLTPLE